MENINNAVNLSFRPLTESDVELRANTVRTNGVQLLLYKDARVDTSILNETLGIYGWKKTFRRDTYNNSLICTVYIRDPETGEWIGKEDVGTPSNNEEVKGEYSDSFKRSCSSGLAIGMELYSAPFIWIPSSKCAIESRNGKAYCKDSFTVSRMVVCDHKIGCLEIINNRTGEVVFSWKDEKILNSVSSPAPATAPAGVPVPQPVAPAPAPGTADLSEALRLTINQGGQSVTLRDYISRCNTTELQEKFLKFLSKRSSGSDTPELYALLLTALKSGQLSFGS